jgi:cell division septation protein DedD
MKIINILIFVGAFVLVTAGLIFLNSVFTNIFQLDFSAASENVVVQDSTKSVDKVEDLAPAVDVVARDLKKPDTLAAQITPLADSVKTPVVQREKQQISQTIQPAFEIKEEKIPEMESSGITVKDEADTTYIKWVKDTAKMFEAMEPKKAAKIIKNYSNDNARDIMYKMKKKKAAEILGELDPVTANKITRYWENF